MPSLLLAPRLEPQAGGSLLPGAGLRRLSSAAPALGWWGTMLMVAWEVPGCGT